MNIRNACLILIVGLFFYSFEKKPNNIQVNAGDLTIGISENGLITELISKTTKKNYLTSVVTFPLFSVQKNGKVIFPISVTAIDSSTLLFHFPENIEANIKLERHVDYLSFELKSITNNQKIETAIWGPFATVIKETVGETVGVVQDGEFAIGIQSLNLKTIGGYPHQQNDCQGEVNKIDTSIFFLDKKRISEGRYRLSVAYPTTYGSSLQAYARNRLSNRVAENMNHDYYILPAYADGGIIGSKISIFGCPVKQILKTISNIEIGEKLTHPMLDGEWSKISKQSTAAYLIYDFSDEDLDQAISYTKQAGLKYLYNGSLLDDWGHFNVSKKFFKNERVGLKEAVTKAEKEGIHIGIHTLSNFITTNDSYVTPVPDKRLAKVGYSYLKNNIDSTITEIEVDSIKFFDQFRNNALKTIQIDNELIRYESVSKSAPWKLLNCERKAFHTKAAFHSKKSVVYKLADHGYKVFLTDPDLSKEMATNISKLYNFCGLRQISFDGLEGMYSSGLGDYGEALFAQTWYDNLTPDIQNHFIADASTTTHFFWHLYSRMNWGEPWYADFRESQTFYRIKNQEYFRRNLMPSMLGWFSLFKNTSLEDIEWMLARSAAFDAGYAFVCGRESIEKNGNSKEIFHYMKIWENARMSGAFSQQQKIQMQNINNEFHLSETAINKWNLNRVYSYKHEHLKKEKQPGEPKFSSFTLENPEFDQALSFNITAKNTEINNIKIELDNAKEILIPIKLKDGESLKYEGGDKINIYDVTWNSKGVVTVDSLKLFCVKGMHAVNIDCEFSDSKENAKLKVEFKVNGITQHLSPP